MQINKLRQGGWRSILTPGKTAAAQRAEWTRIACSPLLLGSGMRADESAGERKAPPAKRRRGFPIDEKAAAG